MNQPDIVMHLVAESHVDRSIDDLGDFIQTNIVGTFTLLEQSKNYWQSLKGSKKEKLSYLVGDMLGLIRGPMKIY